MMAFSDTFSLCSLGLELSMFAMRIWRCIDYLHLHVLCVVCTSISSSRCMQMATAGSVRGREDLLRVELTEHGRFSELLSMQVPFAIDPEVTLVSVVPEVCSLQHNDTRLK
jgi:hypothetical protein